MSKPAIPMILALTVAVALTSCAPFVDPTQAPARPPATTAPALDPLDLDGNGKVSEFEKQIAAQNAIRDYGLADGRVIPVDPRKPLPPEVVEQVKTNLAPIANEAFPVNTPDDVSKRLFATIDAQAEQTGRGVLFVVPLYSYGEGVIWAPLASNHRQAIFIGLIDREASIAKASRWASAHDYELIVHEQ